jgi:prepilin-type N-terminal cleavage/methylation domain-containing protein
MKRYQAFTLIELLIAMIITSIAITIAVSAYVMISGQFYQHKKISDQLMSAAMLQNLIEQDFFDARTIRYTYPGKLFFSKDGSSNVYSFEEDKIIREMQGGLTDTFFFIPDSTMMYLDKNIQAEDNGLIDELYFSSEILGERESFHFYKEYAAEVFVNIE